jgi:hypothetical protein
MTRLNCLVILLLAGATLPAAEPLQPDPASLTAGLQEAIDALGPQGGQVHLAAGRFLLRRPVFLADNLQILGSGPGTVIQVADEITQPLTADAAKGDTSVRVADASGFSVGESIAVLDHPHRWGYGVSFALIRRIDGNTLHLDVLRHKGLANDYKIENDGRVIHTLTAFRSPPKGYRGRTSAGVEDVTLRNLTILGSGKQGPYHNWYVNSGIYLAGRRIRLENLTIRGVAADAITLSAYGSYDGRYLVRGCMIADVGGHGVHLGDNAQQSLIVNNIMERLGMDGVYFCWGNQRVVVQGNLITGAERYGIGGIGDGGNMDRYAVVANNVIRRSGRAAIKFQRQGDKQRPGRYVNVIGNVIHRAAGAGIELTAARYINVTGNTITETTVALDLAGSADCLVTGNLIQQADVGIRLGDHTDRKGQLTESAEGNILRHNAIFNAEKDLLVQTEGANSIDPTEGSR